ncbi:hypothetical protein EQM13_08045 [Acidilutibacter cellobiosedens]|jgi:hypothetical protein|uniref:Uncharacterized protein n=1 Tax=Acidilutibacter cellobiosedens TaxID=2507161 RepID=A0A410QBY0_9FIRM|nr:hypothetical protein [Acidilutibacter cellobiosedens]MBE6082413.1 hypothetical protein [Tissierellaceae bacterium]QAT61533.1 hypothetical protein EQM13_08045 [Acidilutibacter cellobiosedens]
MLDYLEYIVITLFMVSVIGYILAVVKEKILLKNNIILIDKKSVTQSHIEETDMKEFILDGFRIKSGDELKVFLKDNKKFEGIVIGAKKKEKSILMVTYGDEVKKFSVENIAKFKIISKYGKFFKEF